ncbi:HEAT repeat domain-containing protein [Spirillospora sp. NPDC050679]
MNDKSLIAAVRADDADSVRSMLPTGELPDVVDDRGMPLLHVAVDAFAARVVQELSWPLQQLNRRAPDGRTPLLRAIDLGADDIVEALIFAGAELWHEDAEDRDALALARHWQETGPEAELRHRTGASGPVSRRTVRIEDDAATCEELSLEGLTVRTGHVAILTRLEPRYGITSPFETLMSRALAEPDPDHPVWAAALSTLRVRRDPAVWDAAAALRDRAEPLERLFGAEVLRWTVLFDESDDAPYDEPLVDLFLPWTERESDLRVMRTLTAGLADAVSPRTTERLIALTDHHDQHVRQWAASGLHWAVRERDPAATATAVRLTGADDPKIRWEACRLLGSAPADDPNAADALAARLDDPDENVRVTAAIQLAMRDDPRGDELLNGLTDVSEDAPWYWDFDAAWRRRLREDTG